MEAQHKQDHAVRRVPKVGARWKALVAFACLSLAGCGEEDALTAAEPVRAIKYMTVGEQSQGQLRRISGLVHSAEVATLSFETGGQVHQVHVELGDALDEGDLIAELDAAKAELNLQAARAELEQAKANLRETRETFTSRKQLLQDGWISRTKYESALSAFESAKSGLNIAESRLQLALREQRNTILRAPFAGAVSERRIEPYQQVAAGEPIVELQSVEEYEVRLSVPETMIEYVEIGQAVTVSLPGQNIVGLKGKVVELGRRADAAYAFPARLALIDPPPIVRHGMSAEAAFELSAHRPAHLLPLSAVQPQSGGGGAVFVYDETASQVNLRQVGIGGIRDNLVEVVNGVSSGEVIAAAGVEFLSDGQKVTLWESPER